MDDDPQFEGVETPKNPQKGGVVRHFPAKLAKL